MFDLLDVQGTLKSLLHLLHNSKASVLQCSASHIGTWLLEKPCEVKITQSRPSLQPHGLYSPWNSPGKNIGAGCCFLLQVSNSNSNEYSGLISFRIGWYDLLAVQGTLKSLLQHHSSKASILWRSAFFMVQLSHLYVVKVYKP